MLEAKQGCLLGCAAAATSLVIAAAGLLVYVATHREEWGRAAAAQTREFVEEGTRRQFPEGVSERTLERLGETVERGQLRGKPSKENLERLVKAQTRIANLETVAAEEWAAYLVTLLESLYEGIAPIDRLSEMESELETIDFDSFDAEKAEEWIERLIRDFQLRPDTLDPAHASGPT